MSVASAVIEIRGTAGRGVALRPTPDTTHPPIGRIPDGATPQYLCFADGQVVDGVRIWFSVSYAGTAGYYSSAYDTARYGSAAEITRTYGVAPCGTTTAEPAPPVTSGPAAIKDAAAGPSPLDDVWKVAKCGAVLVTYSVVAARLIRVLRKGSSTYGLARMLVSGEVTRETVVTVASGILGVQDVIDNCTR